MEESYDGEIEGQLVEYFPKGKAVYANGRFEAGQLRGLDEDDYYLKIVKDGKEDLCVALRADECLGIISALSTTLHAAAMKTLEEKSNA